MVKVAKDIEPSSVFTMTNTSSFLLPKGTTVLAGKAAPLFGQSGGGVQWWISVLG